MDHDGGVHSVRVATSLTCSAPADTRKRRVEASNARGDVMIEWLATAQPLQL